MPLKTQQDETPTLNLTSMIDVLFLLIIFFMVATRFDEFERNIDVAVPEVSETGESRVPPQPLVVCVFDDGRVELDGQPVTLEELTTELTAASGSLGKPTVVIRGDAACAYQRVAAVLATCGKANISEVSFAVHVAGVGGSPPTR